MGNFIIDANLPSKIPCWSGNNFMHVLKINAAWEDEEIWQFAKQHNLIIVTKDKDFSVKQILEGSPPKLVHIKFGNLKLNEFSKRIEAVWQEVERLLRLNSVINIYLNTLEAIR